MKNAFNEGLSYINHFVVPHLFLRRPQMSSTFTTHLILIINNLRKKLAFSFEYSSNNSILLVYIENFNGYLLINDSINVIVKNLNMICVYLLLQITCQKRSFTYLLN